MNNKTKNQAGFAHLLAIVGVVAVLSLVGLAGWRATKNSSSQNNTVATETTDNKEQTDEASAPTAEIVIREAEEASNSPTPTPAAQPGTAAPEPMAPTQPAPITNCGGSQYNGTNTAFMSTDKYIATKKFNSALAFAGLTRIVDADRTVVFTMTDSVFESLSAEQLAFMNQSPENMKSVLGWHIVTSCQTYASVFKNASSPISLQTLNGAVTYSPSGRGKVGSAEIGIWDWFTSNGAVHYISDYIKPPQI